MKIGRNLQRHIQSKAMENKRNTKICMLFRKSDDDINGYYDTVINLSSYHKEITN